MQNDMRDMLVELLEQAEGQVNNDVPPLEMIANYLIANGVVLPPCKVGDTAYCVYHNKIIQGTVNLIRPFISKEETIFKGNIICEIDSIFYDDGRKEEIELYVVFAKPYGSERVAYLTKEQAEQKLKELRENG